MLRMTFVWALAVLFGNVMASEPSISSELSEMRKALMRMEAMVGSAGSVGLVDKSPQEDQVNNHHHHGHQHDHGHEHQHHHKERSRNTHVDSTADVKIASKRGIATLAMDLSAVDDHRAADGSGAHASPTEYQDSMEEPAGDSVEGGTEGDEPNDDDDSDDDSKATLAKERRRHAEMYHHLLATKSQDTYADVDSAVDALSGVIDHRAADGIGSHASPTEYPDPIEEPAGDSAEGGSEGDEPKDYDDSDDDAAAETTSNADFNAAGYEDGEDLKDQQLLTKKSQHFAGETAGLQEEEEFHGKAKDSLEDTHADVDPGDDVADETTSNADIDAAEFEDEKDLTDQQLIAKYGLGTVEGIRQRKASNTQAGNDADANDDDVEQDDGDMVSTSNTLLDADADVLSGAHMAEQTTSKADNDAAEHLVRLVGTSETVASSTKKGEDADTYADVDSGADVAVEATSNADDDAVGYGDEEDLTDQQLLAKKSQHFASEAAASNTQDEDTYADVDSGADMVAETTNDADNAAAEHEDEDLTKGMKENRAKVLARRAALRQQRLAKKTEHFAEDTASSNIQASKDADRYSDVDSGADVASETTSNADNDAAGYEDEEDATDQQLLAKKSQRFAGETAASSIQEVNDADANDEHDEQDDGDLVLLRKPESLQAKEDADGDGEQHEASNTLLDADAGEAVASSTQKGEDAEADGDDPEKDAHADVDSAADVMAQVISDEDNDADEDEGEALTVANPALNPVQDANGKKNDAAWYDVRRFLG